MELVIKIPESIYDSRNSLIFPLLNRDNAKAFQDLMLEAIQNGTPLPKGHGAIIDIKQIHRVEIEDSCTGRKMIWNNNPKINDTIYYLTAPTIIEADKGEEE